jgi:hypothetical protein
MYFYSEGLLAPRPTPKLGVELTTEGECKSVIIFDVVWKVETRRKDTVHDISVQIIVLMDNNNKYSYYLYSQPAQCFECWQHFGGEREFFL